MLGRLSLAIVAGIDHDELRVLDAGVAIGDRPALIRLRSPSRLGNATLAGPPFLEELGVLAAEFAQPCAADHAENVNHAVRLAQ